MEKEKVLEIETQEVFDKVAVRIKYQNYEVLKRVKFYDEEIQVGSFLVPGYIKEHNMLYVQGEVQSKDNKIFLVDKEDLKKILEKVNKINEKYGISKRWRAEKNEEYFYIGETGLVRVDKDNFSYGDNMLYNLGNYFKTREEAKKVIDSKEWKDFWAKVKAGEIGGDE
jgi:hypothetical protein